MNSIELAIANGIAADQGAKPITICPLCKGGNFRGGHKDSCANDTAAQPR